MTSFHPLCVISHRQNNWNVHTLDISIDHVSDLTYQIKISKMKAAEIMAGRDAEVKKKYCKSGTSQLAIEL